MTRLLAISPARGSPRVVRLLGVIACLFFGLFVSQYVFWLRLLAYLLACLLVA